MGRVYFVVGPDKCFFLRGSAARKPPRFNPIDKAVFCCRQAGFGGVVRRLRSIFERQEASRVGIQGRGKFFS